MDRNDERTNVEEMRSTYLIQRLEKPWGDGASTPFSFGGGYQNGGLTKDALKLLDGLFKFDYMGAAEFEFGAVPVALGKIAKQAEDNKLTAGWCTIALKDVEPDFRELPRGKRGKTHWPKIEGDAKVYYICNSAWELEVETRIHELAAERYNSKLKCNTNLASVLRPEPGDGWKPQTCGWLELDNGFMFFTDEAMFERTLKMFQELAGAEV